MIFLDVQKINPEVDLPSKGSEDAANFDLHAAETVYIKAGDTKVVSTGLRMRVPSDYVLEIYSRSGMAKNGIQVANAPGQVDADYRGIVGVLLYNSSSNGVMIHQGDRMAQCRLVGVERMMIVDADEIKAIETLRGEGGFGSTGVD